eukprot:TRINITY_DN2473_c0_g1_i2.p1 TRINITY_DN2473_c0_g1~~TRINITY_DN2473_c0_g1_i2.p1  ORF type:complete len:225 (-),score=22.13 TRINITY_DN2473_c0_g1_i2:74-748(-)
MLMKNAEFVALLIANSHKAKNIRVYSEAWVSGARRTPFSILSQIGRVVRLIQCRIDEGLFCDGEKEGLLIYNFQPLMFIEGHAHCSFDIIIRPMARLDETKELIGKPLQIAIDGVTHKVMNNTQAMIDLQLTTPEEAESEGLEPPTVYGIYKDYLALTCFLAFSSDSYFSANDLFHGRMNNSSSLSMKRSFDTFIEARTFLIKEASVNGGRNNNGPKVAKFLVG